MATSQAWSRSREGSVWRIQTPSKALPRRSRSSTTAAMETAAALTRARSRRLNNPCGLDALGDDVIRAMLVRSPFCCHDTVRTCCRRLNALIRSPSFRDERLRSGYAENGLVVAGGYNADTRTTTACWLLAGERWRPIGSLHSPRAGACTVVYQGEMWVIGGRKDNKEDRPDGSPKIIRSVEAFNPRTGKWRKIRSLAHPRLGHVAGVVGNKVIVAGGGNQERSVEQYNPETGRWTELPLLPEGAFYATACVLNNRLYVAGSTITGTSDQLWMWDGAEWHRKASLPTGRDGAAGFVHNGKMVVAGGRISNDDGTDRVDTRSVIIYDELTDTWETGEPLVDTMANGSIQSVVQPNGDVVLYGGGMSTPQRLSDGFWEELPDAELDLYFGVDDRLMTRVGISTAAMSSIALVPLG